MQKARSAKHHGVSAVRCGSAGVRKAGSESYSHIGLHDVFSVDVDPEVTDVETGYTDVSATRRRSVVI